MWLPACFLQTASVAVNLNEKITPMMKPPFFKLLQADDVNLAQTSAESDVRISAHPSNIRGDEPDFKNLKNSECVPVALAGRHLILIAEDDEINLDMLQAQLELLGYVTEAACDGATALAMWRSERYALLLTDCHMPNTDGFELTAAIRREEPAGIRLPIIAVTADAMQGVSERCIAQGMDDYLSKPLLLDELGRMLIKWMPLPVRVADYPVWDGGTLSRLIGDKPDLRRRLLEKFLVKGRMRIDEMLNVGEDRELAVHAAHALKSAARTVGALRLGELCQAMEDGVAMPGEVSVAFAAAECNIKAVLQS